MITDKILWVDYVQVKRMNPSTLVAGCKSMLSLRNLISDGFREETNAMRMGSGVHALLLEPDQFHERFCVMPAFHLSPDNVTGKGVPSQTRTTDWYKNEVALFVADNPDKTIMGQTQYDQCLRAIESIWARPKMRELVESSAKEVTVYGEILGVECKGRLDLLNNGTIADLKTTPNVHKKAFGRIFSNLNYAFKLAFYRELVRQNWGGVLQVELITQELTGDFDNALVSVPAIVLDNAWSKVVEVMTAYKRCLETNVWPGVDGGKDYYELDVPNWAMDGDEEFDWSSTVESTDNEVAF
jgi:exodeoxyribonuclease VIII